MNRYNLLNILTLSFFFFQSVPARSDSSEKSFRALVNFGELLVIERVHKGVRIKTSDRDLPIEMIAEPSAPSVTELNTPADSEGFIPEAALEKLEALASKNMGFVLTDVLSSSVTTCVRLNHPYGDPYFYRETLSTFRFSIPIDDFPPIKMISTRKFSAIVDFCERKGIKQ